MKKRIARILVAAMTLSMLLSLLPATVVSAAELPKRGREVYVGTILIYTDQDPSGAFGWNNSVPGVSFNPASNTLTLRSYRGSATITAYNYAEQPAGSLWYEDDKTHMDLTVAVNGVCSAGSIQVDGNLTIRGAGMLDTSFLTSIYGGVAITQAKVHGTTVNAEKGFSVNTANGGAFIGSGSTNGTIFLGRDAKLTVGGKAVIMEGRSALPTYVSKYAARKSPSARVVKALSMRKRAVTMYRYDPVSNRQIPVHVQCDTARFPYVSIQPAASKLVLNASAKTLFPGQLMHLGATTFPRYAASSKVTYTSNNRRVATVDKNTGQVLALAAGKATITARNAQGKRATCVITVNAKPNGSIPVSYVELNRDELLLKPRQKYALTAKVYPSKDANQKVQWESSDKQVATVDSRGRVTARGEGRCYITVKTVDGGWTANCYVDVEA